MDAGLGVYAEASYDSVMPDEIEITVNLKIPSLTVRPHQEPPQRIDNSGVRYLKRVVVPMLPKPGEQLELPARSVLIPCQVIKALWDERLNMFVVYCAYAKRSIPLAEYDALSGAPDWVEQPLLAS